MSEQPIARENTPPEHGRAGRRERGARNTGAATPPMPRLTNRFAPVDILSSEQVERILDAAFTLLETDGMKILGAKAREAYRRHGALVDEDSQMVRIGRDIVKAMLAKAPSSFVLHARNPARDLHIGGNVVNFGDRKSACRERVFLSV